MKFSAIAIVAANLALASAATAVRAADDKPAAATAAASPVAASAPASAPASAGEKIAYTIAFEMLRDLRRLHVEFDIDAALRGFRDADAGAAPALSEEEMKQIKIGFQTETQRKRKSEHRMAELEKAKAAQDFMRDNGTKPGVVTLPSGVQYKVLEAGTGAKPAESDFAVMSFKANLLDGKMFDYAPVDKPYNVKITALVPGWREATRLMPAGSHWQIWVPPSQGYGDRGFGKLVGPAEVLVYDVHLISTHQ